MRVDMTTRAYCRVNPDNAVFTNADTGQCQPLGAVRPVFDNVCADAASATQNSTPADAHQVAIRHRDRR